MVSAKEAEHILRRVKEDKAFRLYLGTTLRSLKELAEALDIMADKAFRHNVVETRNDFGNWVKDVVGDDELADQIMHLKSKEGILKKVDDRIEELEGKMAESNEHGCRRFCYRHDCWIYRWDYCGNACGNLKQEHEGDCIRFIILS